MSKRIISTLKAPRAIGPYSQAVQTENLLFVSGQIALDPTSGEIIKGDIQAQTRRVMENIKSVVEAAGGSLDSIVKCTLYLKNISDFGKVNEVYGSYFKTEPPARATVEVSALPKNVDIEIDAIAMIEK